MSRLTLEEYIPLAYRTASARPEVKDLLPESIPDQMHAMTGILTEVGELLDAWKRYIWYGSKIDFVNLEEEIGDMCWYWALYMSSVLETCSEDVIQNIMFLVTQELKYAKLKPAGEKEQTLPQLSQYACYSLVHVVSNMASTQAQWDVLLAEDEDVLYAAELVADPLTFIIHLASIHGFDFEVVLYKNIEKLKARFPDKFTEEAALNRDLVKERKILEG